MSEPSNEGTPLSVIGPGRTVRILSVDAGRGLRARLSSMGLLPGVEVQVMSNAKRGPFIVALKGTRVMLGRGMLDKITVV